MTRRFKPALMIAAAVLLLHSCNGCANKSGTVSAPSGLSKVLKGGPYTMKITGTAVYAMVNWDLSSTGKMSVNKDDTVGWTGNADGTIPAGGEKGKDPGGDPGNNSGTGTGTITEDPNDSTKHTIKVEIDLGDGRTLHIEGTVTDGSPETGSGTWSISQTATNPQPGQPSAPTIGSGSWGF